MSVRAAASGDGSLSLWDAASGKLLRRIEGEGPGDPVLALSPDGQTLATGSYDNRVRLWELKPGPVKAILQGHTAEVRSVAISPDGEIIAAGGGWVHRTSARRSISSIARPAP